MSCCFTEQCHLSSHCQNATAENSMSQYHYNQWYMYDNTQTDTIHCKCHAESQNNASWAFNIKISLYNWWYTQRHHLVHTLTSRPLTLWLGTARKWLRQGLYCCSYIYHLNQTWIRSLKSSSLQMRHLSAVLPDDRWCTMECKLH